MLSLVVDPARPIAARPYLLPSFYLTCIIGSFFSQSKTRDASVTTILIYLIIQIPKCATGEKDLDLLLPMLGVLALVRWLDFFVFHSPRDFYRPKDKENVPKSFLGQLGWHISLCTSMRGVGWNWQVNNVREAADERTTKWQANLSIYIYKSLTSLGNLSAESYIRRQSSTCFLIFSGFLLADHFMAPTNRQTSSPIIFPGRSSSHGFAF